VLASGSVAVISKLADELFSGVEKVEPPEKEGGWLGAGGGGS
jgi:hypothetical protein